MNMIMKMSIVFLILLVLLSGIFFYLLMRQNHNQQKLESEYESLQQRLASLEIQPQTGQDDEKMKLASQLPDTNIKLINTDFGKFERELRNSNDKWLWSWTGFFVAIVAIVVTVTGVAFWVVVKSMIADRVEERLNGFKESVDKVEIQRKELRILKKERALSLLDNSIHFPRDKFYYSQQINKLPDQVLIDAFCDENVALYVKHEITTYLVNRNPVQCVVPAVDFLNLVINTNRYPGENNKVRNWLREIIKFIGQIKRREAYDGLKNLLNRLLNEKSKHKDWFLTSTVFSLAYIGSKLDNGDSISMIRKTIPDLDVSSYDEDDLKNLVGYFYKFQEHEGIKEILTNDLTEGMPEVEKRCLQLLREYDADFVRDWEQKKEDTNTESEESDESKPTT